MTETRPNKSWLREHARDAFVKRARKESYRSRAVYKLREINERYRVFRPGMTVVDLGAAPGGWSQYARQRVGPHGRILAVDLAAIDPLVGVEIIRGDLTDRAVLDLVMRRLAGNPVDLVISDMAPNISGERVSDQAKIIDLGERAVDFAVSTLTPGGQLLLKTFQGEGFTNLRESVRKRFEELVTCKPRASKARSREIYLLGRGFRPNLRP